MDSKQKALAEYLGVEPDDLRQSDYDEDVYFSGSFDYLVLTDDEADERAYDAARDTLWAFNLGYLSGYVGFDATVLSPVQDKLCENFQPIIVAVLGNNLNSAINDAIDADGRGHFLSGYDGEEHKSGDYYIYRIN